MLGFYANPPSPIYLSLLHTLSSFLSAVPVLLCNPLFFTRRRRRHRRPLLSLVGSPPKSILYPLPSPRLFYFLPENHKQYSIFQNPPKKKIPSELIIYLVVSFFFSHKLCAAESRFCSSLGVLIRITRGEGSEKEKKKKREKFEKKIVSEEFRTVL